MSTRTNAAGEKYALRGIYGTEPYWPQEKLKICVTGAGGFIGTPLLFSFLICAIVPYTRLWIVLDRFFISRLLISFCMMRAFFERERLRDWERESDWRCLWNESFWSFKKKSVLLPLLLLLLSSFCKSFGLGKVKKCACLRAGAQKRVKKKKRKKKIEEEEEEERKKERKRGRGRGRTKEGSK